ncbi:MAG: hypothetical protein U0793_08550 [Gemmataceae bacterium]
MIIIRFASIEEKRKALDYLVGRFRFTTWSTGEMLVPEESLAHLAHEQIRFTVDGTPTYEQLVPPLRDLTPTQVQ